MISIESKNFERQSFKYSPRDLRALEGMVAAGKTFSMNVPDGQMGDFVQRIKSQLAGTEVPPPAVIFVNSPTLETDVSTVVAKAMGSFGFPSDFKNQNPEYYIWLNADQILERGFAQELSRVSKYAKNIFIFDHPYDFSTIPSPLQYALGAECDRNISFTPIE